MREVPRRQLAAALILAAVTGPLLWVLLPASLGGRTSWTMVVGHSMEPTMYPGDLVVTRTAHYEIGDVVVYSIPSGTPGEGVKVIHRIVGGDAASGFITLGDNRDIRDPWRPRPADITGEAWRVIPKGGWALAWLRSPLAIGLFMSVMVFMVTVDLIDQFEEHEPRHARPPLARHARSPMAVPA